MKSGKIVIEKSSPTFYIHNEVKKPISVVFLHGTTHTAKIWEDSGSLKALADAGYSAISINLPGYIKNYGYNSELLPDVWLRAAYDKLHILKPILVCASGSSICALPFMAKHPTRISGFVGVAPANLESHKTLYPNLTIPVLAIWGKNDNFIANNDGKIFAQVTKNGEYKEIPDAGHSPHVDQPEAFNDILLDFVKKNA